jgi:hypothetical protein
MNVSNHLVTIMQHVITQKETLAVRATRDLKETDFNAQVWTNNIYLNIVI